MRGSIVSAANYTSYYKRRTQSNKINCAELDLLSVLTEMTHLLAALHNADQQGCLSWLPVRWTVSKIHGPLKSWGEKKPREACEELSNPKTGIARIKLGTQTLKLTVDLLILPFTWVTFNSFFFPLFGLLTFIWIWMLPKFSVLTVFWFVCFVHL